MKYYTWPESIYPKTCELTPLSKVLSFNSPHDNSASAVDLLGDRWHMSFALPEARRIHGGAREAMLAKLRGGANWVALWHFARPVPLGTLRGTPTLAVAAAQGADQITLQTTAGATLKAGDMLGVSGLLLMCADDCTANAGGLLVVPLTSLLRKALVPGAAVSWSRPSAYFKLASAVPVGYRPGAVNSTQAEFVEVWSPGA